MGGFNNAHAGVHIRGLLLVFLLQFLLPSAETVARPPKHKALAQTAGNSWLQQHFTVAKLPPSHGRHTRHQVVANGRHTPVRHVSKPKRMPLSMRRRRSAVPHNPPPSMNISELSTNRTLTSDKPGDHSLAMLLAKGKGLIIATGRGFMKNVAQEGSLPTVLVCLAFGLAVALVGGGAVLLTMGELHPIEDKWPTTPDNTAGSLQYIDVGLPEARRSVGGSNLSVDRIDRVSLRPSTMPGTLPERPTRKEKQDRAGDRYKGASSGSSGTGTPERRKNLCPSLVVPSGAEFVFAVQQLINTSRQDTSFDIVDLKGTPLSRVVIAEKGSNATSPSIFLQTMLKLPLASVSTSQWHLGNGGILTINRASGSVFGKVEKEQSSGRYVIKHHTGQKLLTFHGDFREKAVNVMSSTGQLVGATERCIVDFDEASHYQVRVAPNTDAGLVICGLLAIDKLEGSTPPPGSSM